jgi:hypothetical protein
LEVNDVSILFSKPGTNRCRHGLDGRAGGEVALPPAPSKRGLASFWKILAVLMKEVLIRFVIGGFVVSAFAVFGDLFKPKTFAGLFGAAPSVALATIALTVAKDGRAYAAVEAHSMIVGAIAFFLYACLVSRLLFGGQWSALRVTVSALSIWSVCALGLWFVFLR